VTRDGYLLHPIGHLLGEGVASEVLDHSVELEVLSGSQVAPQDVVLRANSYQMYNECFQKICC